MNEKDLFRALGDVDDAWLAAAEAPPQKRKPRLAGGLIAACLCVAVLALTASELSSVFHNGASSDGSLRQPPMEVRRSWTKSPESHRKLRIRRRPISLQIRRPPSRMPSPML